jgi:hypothetical protein
MRLITADYGDDMKMKINVPNCGNCSKEHARTIDDAVDQF